ncbi:alpha/beta fold hydrolase [Asanoa hainanensis]|nr:alpha/beta fold hydrolase [Asanoa hainanensis]
MRTRLQSYLDALNARDADAAVALFAPGSTLEDPVGTGVADAHERLPRMFEQVPAGSRFTLDTPIRASHGAAAAMAFTLETVVDGTPVRVRSLDVMEFGDDGLITHMNAYTGPSDQEFDRPPAFEGFEHGYAVANGVRLHYEIGGEGEPLVLLDGFPRTTHALHGIMSELVKRYRVIAVDYRGQGGSDKPADGYDKKTMARDVYELVRGLGYDKVHIAGGDMGGMVAYTFAANHPEATAKLALWDAGPFGPSHATIASFPRSGAGNPWWYPLSHVDGLPAKLLAGRFRPLVDWAADHFAVHPEKITEADREVCARAYASPEAVTAAFATYGAYHQDIVDNATYPRLAMPVLCLGNSSTLPFLKSELADNFPDNAHYVTIDDTGHYIAEEQPEAVAAELEKFFG